MTVTTTPRTNPTGTTAVERLQPSRLTNQLEGLGDDIDITSLNLGVKGRASIQIRELLTDAQLTRTIQGASTVTLTVEDRDLALLNSGLFGTALTITDDYNKSVLGAQLSFFAPVDIELDGLFFRLVAMTKPVTSRAVTLTFEDREVALLRSYPKKNDPLTYRTFPGWTRIQVMEWLVQEVTETPIRLVSPMLGSKQPITNKSSKPPRDARDVSHSSGFPASGGGVTVKNATASKTQLANLQDVLDVGVSMNVPRIGLVCAVMVVTQESDASKAAVNGSHIGLFQQDSRDGSAWVKLGGATQTDASADAHAFFTVWKQQYAATPSADAATLCDDVQHSGLPALYAQWRTEAEHTVDVYLGNTVPGAPGATGGPTQTPTISAGLFARGSTKTIGDRTVMVREDNWACLQRLAQEVGWRCYCVSGTIYIETDAQILAGRVRYEIDEDTEGVDGVGFNVNTSRAQAQATVQARASRWAAPPGTVVAIDNVGPVNGRWFVSSISRSLLASQTATITLSKPQPTLADAESATPVQAGPVALSGSGQQLTPGEQATSSYVRSRIVAAAKRALAHRGNYRYLQSRPYPSSLFGTPPIEIDCSAFAILCYKEGEAPDPSGHDYDGRGFTGDLFLNGTVTTNPQAGDLAFYGTDPLVPTAPRHVAVVVGDGSVISMGGPGDPSNPAADYDRSPLPNGTPGPVYVTYKLASGQTTAVGP